MSFVPFKRRSEEMRRAMEENPTTTHFFAVPIHLIYLTDQYAIQELLEGEGYHLERIHPEEKLFDF